MSVNRGKQFEEQIKKAFEKIPDTSVVRLIDPQGGQAGICNICDFVMYHSPTQFFIECKSCHGNTMSIHTNNPKNKYGMITNTQWEGLLKQCLVTGVVAGVIVWFIDHDVTAFIPIDELEYWRNRGMKSVNIKDVIEKNIYITIIPGVKKRVLFDYDVSKFVEDCL